MAQHAAAETLKTLAGRELPSLFGPTAGDVQQALQRSARRIGLSVRRLCKLACLRFPAVNSFDTFDFAAIPSPNKPLVLELVRSRICPRPRQHHRSRQQRNRQDACLSGARAGRLPLRRAQEPLPGHLLHGEADSVRTWSSELKSANRMAALACGAAITSFPGFASADASFPRL
jgi:hypothetical protein